MKKNRYEEDIGFLVDENGRIEWSSEKALGFTGRARSILIGGYLPEMIAEDSRAAFLRALQQGWKGIVKNPFFTVFKKEGEADIDAEVKITRLTSHEKRRLWVLVQRPASKPGS